MKASLGTSFGGPVLGGGWGGVTRREESIEGGWADTAGAGNTLLWKGFPRGLFADHVLGVMDADVPQATGGGEETETAKEEGWFQPGTLGLVVKTIGWLNPEGWPAIIAPGTTEGDWLKTKGAGLHGAAWAERTGTPPRPGRGPSGAGALVLKRSRGLVCRVAGCPVDCPGGSEIGGAKMSAASKSFAGDWWDREGYGGVTQEQWSTALFGFLVCNSTLGTQKEKKNFFLLLINYYQKTPKDKDKTKQKRHRPG